jgi:hypothetical protein
MIVKLQIDLMLALLFIVLFGFRITGGFAHEWTGVAFFGLLAAHSRVNLGWYKSLFRGEFRAQRIVKTALNLLLLADAVILCVSGFLNSSHVFAFLELGGSMGIKRLHSLAAYWALVLVGLHVGIDWGMVVGFIGKKAGVKMRPAAAVLRILAIAIAGYGVWASFDRGLGEKLFKGAAFDFWDSERPGLLFFLHNLAILGLYVFVAHYALALSGSKTAAKEKA